MTRHSDAQSDAVNEAKGNPGRHVKRRKVSDSSPSKNGTPAQLSAKARKVWNLLAPDLRQLQFLRDIDIPAFARYCEHAAKWWELTKDIKKNGDTYVTDSLHGKMERLRPAFIVRERVERQMITLEDRFGLNPAYRQQILMRMAGLVGVPPAPGGELFNQDNPDDPDTGNTEPQPSAVGILRSPSPSTH